MSIDALIRAANREDAQVPQYKLPDLFTFRDGRIVNTVALWRERREELLALFTESMYGHVPQCPVEQRATVVWKAGDFLEGLASASEIDLLLRTRHGAVTVRVLVVVPNGLTAAAPVFLGYNFYGNATVSMDPRITLGDTFVRNELAGVEANRLTESGRGGEAHRWPLEFLIRRGYAVVTACMGALAPDSPEHWRDGAARLFPSDESSSAGGAIAWWAWGLRQLMDYIVGDTRLDAQRVTVIGHSRLGKAALWAGAQDERFARVISNNSGCGGASLARRRLGETVEIINAIFPYWFCRNYHAYGQNVNSLPIDQHALLALVAPRQLHVASASEDWWADPRGEFLAAREASAAYRLYGKQGLTEDQTQADVSGNDCTIGGSVRYHRRTGKHDLLLADWERYV
ncbi:MAG: acetylxylan esterase [Verrucomicrobiota bacterium]|nr:acetylxylan esterase [Verrucomicrobiota bacterium]